MLRRHEEESGGHPGPVIGACPSTDPGHRHHAGLDVFRRTQTPLERKTRICTTEVQVDHVAPSGSGSAGLSSSVSSDLTRYLLSVRRENPGQLARVFRLTPGLSKYRVKSELTEDDNPAEPLPHSGDVIYLNLRSIMQILVFLSKGVCVPAEHVETGVVPVTPGLDGRPYDWTRVTSGLFFVASQKHRPRDAESLSATGATGSSSPRTTSTRARPWRSWKSSLRSRSPIAPASATLDVAGQRLIRLNNLPLHLKMTCDNCLMLIVWDSCLSFHPIGTPAMQFGPILARELLTSGRNSRHFRRRVVLAACVLLVIGFNYFMWSLMVDLRHLPAHRVRRLQARPSPASCSCRWSSRS